MAELLIKNSSVGFIKAIIFDKDGTLSNSEESLLELAKTRVEFAVAVVFYFAQKMLNFENGFQKTSWNSKSAKF